MHARPLSLPIPSSLTDAYTHPVPPAPLTCPLCHTNTDTYTHKLGLVSVCLVTPARTAHQSVQEDMTIPATGMAPAIHHAVYARYSSRVIACRARVMPTNTSHEMAHVSVKRDSPAARASRSPCCLPRCTSRALSSLHRLLFKRVLCTLPTPPQQSQV